MGFVDKDFVQWVDDQQDAEEMLKQMRDANWVTAEENDTIVLPLLARFDLPNYDKNEKWFVVTKDIYKDCGDLLNSMKARETKMGTMKAEEGDNKNHSMDGRTPQTNNTIKQGEQPTEDSEPTTDTDIVTSNTQQKSPARLKLTKVQKHSVGAEATSADVVQAVEGRKEETGSKDESTAQTKNTITQEESEEENSGWSMVTAKNVSRVWRDRFTKPKITRIALHENVEDESREKVSDHEERDADWTLFEEEDTNEYVLIENDLGA